MQSAYSFMGSRLHLVLEDDVADAFNRMQDAWFDAQKNHKEKIGTEWNPAEPLLIDCAREDTDVWNKIGSLINLLIEINGGSLHIPEEEMTSDYLVKL
jgi:hypothetical protein